ncbi:hypothetical protein INR49_028941 [Caranx melampygus]|nr:hypothetical protein INR49_028941 [Caranx melampygus]
MLGKQLDGIWHTAIVAYGDEFFFGGEGISSCSPGGTMLGPPDTVVELGETEVSEEIFMDYLSSLGESTYRPFGQILRPILDSIHIAPPGGNVINGEETSKLREQQSHCVLQALSFPEVYAEKFRNGREHQFKQVFNFYNDVLLPPQATSWVAANQLARSPFRNHLGQQLLCAP